MNWPGAGNDPFYLNNPTENTARRSYYGINAVFNMKCDGVLGNSGSQYLTYYNQRTSIPSPVALDATVTVDETIDISVDVTAEATYSGTNLKLRAALIELQYDIPGSGWTYTHCERAMLDMAPDPNGITFSISAGQTVNLATSFPVPTYPPTGLDNLAIVIFVQNDNTREILQAKHVPIPLNFPSISITDFDVTDDAPGGNENGYPEPGETCEAWVELTNNPIFATAREATATLSTSDPMITVTNATANFGDIPGGFSTSNIGNPFEFEIDESLEAHIITFQVDVEANGGEYQTTLYFDYMIGIPKFLLVDDDGGSNCEANYISAFEAMDYVINTWDVSTAGSPTGEDLSYYEILVWVSGQTTAPLNADEQTALMSYLDGGGKMFISSENLGDNLGGTAFYTDYMHAVHVSDYVMGFILNGVDGDPITDGASIILVGGAYMPDSQSAIEPDAEAFPIFYYETTGEECGAIRYSGADYALVYAAFPLECASNSAAGYTHRDELFEDILLWLDTPTSVFPNDNSNGNLPGSFEIASISPNPFNPQTTINLNVPVQGEVELAVYNLLGERVALLHSGMMNAGSHRITFDGAQMSSGVYLLKADTPEGVMTEKMVLMK